MKLILATVAFVVAATSAHAISRQNVAGMSCSSVQSVLRSEGAAILRYRSSRGLPIYDRYVSDSRFCAGGEYAYNTTVPTRDGACRVQRCRGFSHDD